ncbi:MAG TPA: hypothetical protein VGJ82_01360 [Thermoanaerobaculia bacterium]
MSLERICAVLGVIIAVLMLAIAIAAVFMQHSDFVDKRAKPSPPAPPPTAEALYFTGSDLQNHRRYREAIEVFNQASNQVRRETAAGQYQAALIQFSLGECYLQIGDCKDANHCLSLLGADAGGFAALLDTECAHARCK